MYLVPVKAQYHHTDRLIHIHEVSSEGGEKRHKSEYRNENYKCMRFLNTTTYHPNPPSLLHSLLLPNPHLLTALFPLFLVFSFCVNLTHFVKPPPSLSWSNCPSHSAIRILCRSLWLTLSHFSYFCAKHQSLLKLIFTLFV